MTYGEFCEEVERAGMILNAMASSKHMQYDFPKVDISIDACECAAQIHGHDVTTSKMLNKAFRGNSAKTALAMATVMTR